jgi:ParB family chromosome partitioning protein
MKLKPAERFPALSALSWEAKQRLLAWCIASCLKPQLGIEGGADPALEEAGRRLNIPFAEFWRPTAANYWSRVKKAHGLGIGAAILGSRWERDHADDKKATLAAALETAFDPTKSSALIAQSTRDKAAAWLPPGLAYGIAEAGPEQPDSTVSADESQDDADETEMPDLPAFLGDDEPAADSLAAAASPQ